MATRSSEETVAAIEKAALDAFYEKGYHGASIREIASRADIGIATLFHHFPSKMALIEQILNQAVDQMSEEIHSALKGLESPEDQLRAATRVLVLAHCRRQAQSFVAQSELRSLTPEAAEIVRAKRRLVQKTFDDIVFRGVETGEFDCDDPRTVSRAIVTMGTMVSRWYRLEGDMSATLVADKYAEMASLLVGTRRDAGIGAPVGSS